MVMNMKIGIIVHSQTGTTLSVAEKLKDRLSNGGHQVKLDRVIPKGEVKPGEKNIEFESKPGITGYDAYVFGGPVQGFSLSPVMKAYMDQIGSLNGKPVAFLVTKGLFFKWTGGNRAVRTMEKISSSKNGKILGSDIVVWMGKGREQRIGETVSRISGLFRSK
jgi:flavodoxin